MARTFPISGSQTTFFSSAVHSNTRPHNGTQFAEGDITRDVGQTSSPTETQTNQQKGYRKQVRPTKRWEDDINLYLQATKAHRDNNDLTNDTTWLVTAQDGLKWDSMERYFVSSRLEQPIRPTTPIDTTTTAKTTTTTTHATKGDDHDEGGADDDYTLLILSHLIES